MKRMLTALWLTLAGLQMHVQVQAQDGIQPYVEYRKRIETAQNISPLDHGLFGEQVSLYNGSTAFSVTDIDVPGNHALPVQLTRKLAVELQPQNYFSEYDSLLRGLGNWDVDVPHMAATYQVAAGNALRCNGFYVPGIIIGPGFRRGEVWQGISVNVPGRGSTSALGVQTQTPRPSGGATYKLTTSDRDVFDCIPMQPGFTGEGFRMTTSSGLRYYFDVGASRTAARLVKYLKDSSGLPSSLYLDRNRLYLLASKIEDRFGNTVQFQYNANGHPTKIWSNDGREINLTYTGGRLATATSHGRTWQYQYTHIGSGLYARLSQVIQPDSSKWQYTYSDDLMPPPDPTGLPPLPWCGGFPLMLDVGFTLTATHPAGASGTFQFNNRRHYRSGVHATECQQTGDPVNPDYDLVVPHYFDVLSIDSKIISGPGLSPMAWNYSYALLPQTLWGVPTTPLPYPCTTCTAEKTVTVSNPDSTKSRYTFGMRYHDNDGRQLKVETLRANETVIRTETSTYMTEAQAASQPFHGEHGTILGYISDPASARIRPVTNRTIHQDGVNFVWQVASTCSGILCYDDLARPMRVTKSSTVSGNPTRTEETTYHDNMAKWVLGQVRTVTCKAPTSSLPAGCGSSGVEMFDRTYDATYAMPWVTKRFGKPEQTLTWDTTSPLGGGQRGTAKTVADGNGNTTTLSNWKGGIPQTIQYPGTPEAPSGATQIAWVNDSGWIEWVNDENGFQTCYGYDAMGRINQVTYPSETVADVCNATTWAITTQVFQQIASTEYGIPANHWRQTVSTGNGRKIVYFDALWRPLVTREYDTANEAGTQRFQRFTYDHEGRTTFASYPATAHNPATGTWTIYDALGRPTSVSQDSELSPGLLVTTTEYQSGFQTRITSPKTHPTTTRYWALDQPTQDHPVYVSHPAGAYTHIARNVFGKPVQLRRSNSSSPTGGTVALNRAYTYNPKQELCRSVEPETGATLMGYDGAGNLKWRAAGLPSGQACEDNGTAPAVAARRADRTYDGRNWLRTLAFPAADKRGNQAWTYTLDGLPATITTANTKAGGAAVVNAYSYNRRRLPTGESVKRGAAVAWAVGYGYNGNGHLASLVYPTSGPTVNYAPNALGQPTQAGAFASGVSYFPNGAIKQFTYGNGIVHTLTQNARGLPARSTDCTTTGACAAANRRLDLQYAYDPHGNVSGIIDHTSSGKQTRGMNYDALDRLIQTTSPATVFGTASYAYDVLDNLTTVSVSAGSRSRNHTYTYDAATRRLSQVKNTVGGAVVANLTYDVQGNLSCKGPSIPCPASQSYEFDFGNRLRNAPTREINYEYDGHGRRVHAMTVGSSAIESQYANSGQVLRQKNYKQNKEIDYIYLGGSMVAFQERPIGTSTNVVKYQHTDALGTPVAVTNAAKTAIEASEYEPYGQLVNKPLFDGPGYTGHVQDAATGLTYMQQRYMDPQLGVFLSVDPVTAYQQPVVSFNRYRYANGNPYKFTDPDGRCGNPIGQAFNEYVGQSLGHMSCDRQLEAMDPKLRAAQAAVERDSLLVAVPLVAPAAGVAAVKVGAPLVAGAASVYRNPVVRLACALGLSLCKFDADSPRVSMSGAPTKPTIRVVEGITRRAEQRSAARESGRTNSSSSASGGNGRQGDGGSARGRDDGFQGTVRVEGRIDSKRLEGQLTGK
ncbi:MAG TPA: RHS repeat-associated core domain-containing protein [Luteimonas sp.]|nr:RHS repeat-associated core domain-containing protein [Luteimonas sp.]